MSYERLKQLAVSESGFLFNPITGDTFSLNPTALFLFNELKKYGDLALASEHLLEQFEVEEIEAQKDIETFVGQLSMHGLI